MSDFWDAFINIVKAEEFRALRRYVLAPLGCGPILLLLIAVAVLGIAQVVVFNRPIA